MKKLFLAFLPLCLVLTSVKSNAAWEACHRSVQITGDSWQIYVNITWNEAPPAPAAEFEYRYTYTTGGVTQTTPWTSLPAGGYIGTVGLGSSDISDIVVRERNPANPTAPWDVLITPSCN